MTRKASLGLSGPIKDPSTTTYLPEFRTDELALHARTPVRMLIGFAYMSLSYVASDICMSVFFQDHFTCTSLLDSSIHCVNILVNRYNVDPPRRFVSPAH